MWVPVRYLKLLFVTLSNVKLQDTTIHSDYRQVGNMLVRWEWSWRRIDDQTPGNRPPGKFTLCVFPSFIWLSVTLAGRCLRTSVTGDRVARTGKTAGDLVE